MFTSHDGYSRHFRDLRGNRLRVRIRHNRARKMYSVAQLRKFRQNFRRKWKKR